MDYDDEANEFNEDDEYDDDEDYNEELEDSLGDEVSSLVLRFSRYPTNSRLFNIFVFNKRSQ